MWVGMEEVGRSTWVTQPTSPLPSPLPSLLRSPARAAEQSSSGGGGLSLPACGASWAATSTKSDSIPAVGGEAHHIFGPTQSWPSLTPLGGGGSSSLAHAPSISHFAERIVNGLFLTDPFVLFRCSADLFPCVWFCSLTDLGSRAGASAFFRFGGLVQLLVQCFGPDELINWSKFWSASDVGLFCKKNLTFPSFVCSVVPLICSRMHGFVPLLILCRFLCSFVLHDLFPSV
jgi:hypothetical protein